MFLQFTIFFSPIFNFNIQFSIINSTFTVPYSVFFTTFTYSTQPCFYQKHDFLHFFLKIFNFFKTASSQSNSAIINFKFLYINKKHQHCSQAPQIQYPNNRYTINHNKNRRTALKHYKH